MRKEYRILLKYFFEKSFDVLQTLREFETVYGVGSIARSTVQFWFDRFSDGDFDLCDKKHTGRPIIEDLSGQILSILEDEPYASTKYIASILQVDRKTVKGRLLHHLHYRKLSCRWIPHILTETQKKLERDLQVI